MSATPSEPLVHASSPERLRALAARLAALPAVTRLRGERYAAEGRVGPLDADDIGVRAVVEGGRAYTTTWVWIATRWESTCTCPVGQDCKHACALAVRYLEAAGAPPAPAGSIGLEALRRAKSPWDRAHALSALLRERRGTAIATHQPPFDAILTEPDPELFLWRLAHAVRQATGGWVPTPLTPWLERDDLRARLVRRDEEHLAAQIAAWTTAQEAAAAVETRSVRFVVDLRRGAQGRAMVVIEGRATSPRLHDERRTPAQLEQLAREAERKPGLLADDQLELIEAYASSLEWNDPDGRHVTPRTLRRLVEIGGGTPALVWSERLDPEFAARFTLTPGAPLVLGHATVDIVPAVEERAGRWVLDLAARWPDGTVRPLREAHLMRSDGPRGSRRAALLLCCGAVHPVANEPPVELADGLRQLGGLPLDPSRHASLLTDLVQRFPSVRDSLAPFMTVVAARPFVALELEGEDTLVVRLLAVPPDVAWEPGQEIPAGARLHAYVAPGHWAPMVEAVDGATNEVLDPADLRPASDWLVRTGARAESGAWRVRLTPKRLEVFDAAWGARPPGIAWYATPAARRLLGEGRAIRASVRVRSSGLDWFSVTAQWESEDLTLTDEDLALLRRARGNFVRLSSGWVRRDSGAEIEQAAAALADLGLEVGGGEQRLTLWQLAQARPESFAALGDGGAGDETAAAIAAMRERVAGFTGLPRVAVPATFHGTLRHYQEEGVDFLAFNATLRLGAVLADDMGLGKTVQALAWLTWLRAQTPDLGPALVVCPASVVHNWVREAGRFTPALRVARLTGAERRSALAGALAGADLLVTNYALLRRDRAALEAIDFGVVILDEAQNVKNPGAEVSKAALALQARHRLALTGTPLENRALDLWSILAFTSPGFLGSRRAFTARYDPPEAPPHLRRLLAARLRPVLLRRMKQQVAPELPPRTEERLDCDLLPVQRKLYAEQLALGRAMLARLMAGDGLDRHRIEILAVLTRLRQICCHPALVGASSRAPSGKFEALWEILEPLLAEGHKVLLFSQFVECLKLLEPEMKKRDIPTHRLTGQTPESAREEVVRRFSEDPRAGVFLVSLKAGGTGLNLTAASHVILFDPWWNPAVEAQAIDRTHRIGQERKVTAFRLLTRGTIEEKIWELQQRKASLAREILGEDGFARGLTREDLMWLFEPAEG